jgi:integrase
MPRLNLTQVAVDRLRPADGKFVTYWDTNLPGFGVRVSPKGRRTWVAIYQVKGGKAVMESLGTAAIIPKVGDARDRARASILKAHDGIDPRAERVRQSVAAQAEIAAQALTFRKLATRYLDLYVDLNCKPSTAREAKRLLGRAADFFTDDKPARDITESDIVDLVSAPPRKGGSTNGLSEATNLLGVVKRCLKWGRKTINPDTRQRYLEINVAAEVDRPLRHKRSRERVLSDEEIVAFWAGCHELGWPFGVIFQLMLATAQRRNEVAGLRWSELDLEGRVWHLPGSRTKNSRPHDVHLSDLALGIIQALPRFVPSPGRPDFMFSITGNAPVNGFAYAKSNLDEFMPTPGWRLHDLRRTVTTGMARLKVEPHIADKVLNHQSGTISGVAAVYNRFAYLDERKEALEVWGRFLAGLVCSDP